MKYNIEIERVDSSTRKWSEDFYDDTEAKAMGLKIYNRPEINSVVMVNTDNMKTIFHDSKNNLLTTKRNEQLVLQVLRKYHDLKWGATKGELRKSGLKENELDTTLNSLKRKDIIFYSPQHNRWMFRNG